MNKNLLISVIIPVYNCEKYLAQAIESVLAQTYQPLEIIVIDDGSTDASAEIAKGFGSVVQYCCQVNSGTAAARNRGLELAKGDYFAFLDADDLWVEDKLTRQMAAFINNPNLDVVFGQVEQFISPELADNLKAKLYVPDKLMPGHIPSALLIKRESFFRVGLFETHWKLAEFASWQVRLTEIGLQTMMLPDLVAKRRLHETNKGIQKKQYQTEYIQILKASLDRRRTKD
ncbi:MULTISPECIES: glycosyltransferase family A protein [unclassified Anabaena]|uniref:glycosyltransferase family 2 protein n=1 Tax=unclassified Anabaena TaxID=2619674 RepID=UPI0014472D61|nr:MULTISPECIES: glycosyltransferase family A protein [unclassified Anabaena]MTJ10250.1 glycosyltransferase family 2 protein [Anabaena sp. UHCC 0204]MTJ55297.1 glycosyltransferase family 2 protein [Anabaena sp. UHCC 0253]